MDTLLRSDIFFFITALFVIILTIILIISGVYLAIILKNLASMSKTLKEAVSKGGEELRDMCIFIKKSSIFTFIFGRKRKKRKN